MVLALLALCACVDAGEVVDERWFEGDNCWKASVRSAKLCVPEGEVGELENMGSCHFTDGTRVRYEHFVEYQTLEITRGGTTCLSYKRSSSPSEVRLTTPAGTFQDKPGGAGRAIVCPDGARYTYRDTDMAAGHFSDDLREFYWAGEEDGPPYLRCANGIGSPCTSENTWSGPGTCVSNLCLDSHCTAACETDSDCGTNTAHCPSGFVCGILRAPLDAFSCCKLCACKDNLPEGTLSSKPEELCAGIVCEVVTCSFSGATQWSRCSCFSSRGDGCSGNRSCSTTVSGNAGEVLEWSSSCGDGRTLPTTIDGKHETLEM